MIFSTSINWKSDRPHARARIEITTIALTGKSPIDRPHARARIEIWIHPMYSAPYIDRPHARARIEISALSVIVAVESGPPSREGEN